MQIASANIIVNGSFEEGAYRTPLGKVFVTDTWQGNDVAGFTEATQGVVPLDGNRMLKFEQAGEVPGSYTTCNVNNIIDVSAYSDIISSGVAVAQASAYFNRIAGDEQTDTWFQLFIYAYAGPLSSIYSKKRNNEYLMRGRAYLTDSDADTATWEQIFLEKAIPSGTDFILVEVMACENVYNDTTGLEFDGHFADMVSFTIIPEPALVIAVDIKPASCPNPLHVKSDGVLPVAILGSDSFDVTTIDATSIRLNGVGPIRHSFEDVAAPGLDIADCNCVEDGPDDFLDLTLKFETQQIVETLGEVEHGDAITLDLTGVLYDETPIEGADCILIRGRHKPINPADLNKDGVVNMLDIIMVSQNWLKSSITED